MPKTLLLILVFVALSSLLALSKKDVMSPSIPRISVLVIHKATRATPSAKKLINIFMELKTPDK